MKKVAGVLSGESSIRLRILLLLVVGLSVPKPLAARVSHASTDQEVFDKADLVVIATVVSSSDTKERSTLPDIEPPNQVIGVETEFKPWLILKGQTEVSKFRLHHYKSTEDFTNGPMLIEFSAGAQPTYILFLVKERGGLYAPASDQTDPAVSAVFRLRGANGVRGHGPEPQVHNEFSGQQWTYPKMLEKADLVVKADWVSTNNSNERSILPDTDIKVVGVTSEFKVNLVLKGPKDDNKLRLHHYKFQDEDDAFRDRPPQLIRIVEPVTRDGRHYPGGGEYLLFLTRESDGRYAPVTGQTDPAVSSVLEIVPALY